ncbi:MAG: chloramphenicol acetyltransferase [Saprospiraceae bacterium]|nr:chloramphenicol acetyltransferase [Saprospiraceae bacterium]
MKTHQEIDLINWNRRAQYEFFKSYDNPFFNITASVDITDLLRFSRAQGLSFFLANLFCSLKTANEIEAFRYRSPKDDSVICYDIIHGGSTILYDDNTFGFCYFEYVNDIEIFCKEGTKRIEAQKQNKGLDPKSNEDNLIHYSTLPWISFTGVTHARKFGQLDTIPKIAFGKYVENAGYYQMPMSVEVNHSMMDGYYVGLYFEKFQALLHSFS